MYKNAIKYLVTAVLTAIATYFGMYKEMIK